MLSFLFYVFIDSINVKNSYISAGVYFIFLKQHPRPNLKLFQNQIWTSLKTSGYWARQILVFFPELAALVLG